MNLAMTPSRSHQQTRVLGRTAQTVRILNEDHFCVVPELRAKFNHPVKQLLNSYS